MKKKNEKKEKNNSKVEPNDLEAFDSVVYVENLNDQNKDENKNDLIDKGGSAQIEYVNGDDQEKNNSKVEPNDLEAIEDNVQYEKNSNEQNEDEPENDLEDNNEPKNNEQGQKEEENVKTNNFFPTDGKKEQKEQTNHNEQENIENKTIKLDKNKLDDIYKSFEFKADRDGVSKTGNGQTIIEFEDDAMKNINSRCGIACFFSRKARLEDMLYNKLHPKNLNTTNNKISLEDLNTIISQSSSCSCGG